tara:strand:- start:333086 stop:334423 length:1338 start_codon:yes stop_codon:yes gene_type:complete
MSQFKGLILYLLFFLSVMYTLYYFISGDYFYLHTFIFFNSILYGFLILISTQASKYIKPYLFFVFLYVVIFCVLNNFVSFSYNKNLFVFSESDAMFYHNVANYYKNLSFSSIINQYFNSYNYDDFGIIIVLSLLYKISASNIILNLFYLVLTIFIIGYYYNLNRLVLNKLYSLISSVLFIASPAFVWFTSSGLKELIMIFLIIAGTYHLIIFLQKNNFSHLTLGVVYLVFLVFLRPVVLIFIIVSFSSYWLISPKKNIYRNIYLLLMVIVGVASWPILVSIFNSYTGGVAFDLFLQYRKESGNIIGGIGFSYVVNILSQVIGPFPDLGLLDKPHLAFYASTLIVKVFLGFYFWYSIYLIFRMKHKVLLILCFFVLIEMVSLAGLLEGLEFRKSFPHFPFFYVVATYGVLEFNKRRKNFKKLKLYRNLYFIVASGIVIIWNLRGVL